MAYKYTIRNESIALCRICMLDTTKMVFYSIFLPNNDDINLSEFISKHFFDKVCEFSNITNELTLFTIILFFFQG